MKQTFKATIGKVDHINKTPKISSKPYYQTIINKFEVGKDVWITIDDKKPKRSDRQNRLYWKYLQYIQDESGNDRMALHEHYKTTCGLGELKVLKDNSGLQREVFVPKSTTEMNKSEFAEYLMKIEADCGIPIPDTEEFIYEGKKEEILTVDYPTKEAKADKF